VETGRALERMAWESRQMGALVLSAATRGTAVRARRAFLDWWEKSLMGDLVVDY
jgi:hypothetical protein